MTEELGSVGQLALRGKSISALRELAEKYTQLDGEKINKLDRNQLISLLSRESNKDTALSDTIAQSSITFKPSFYLMVLAPSGRSKPSRESAMSSLNGDFDRLEESLTKRSVVPARKSFKAIEIVENKENVVEIHMVWQRAHWYWAPVKVEKSHIYELQFGLAILDFSSRKAIIACHTERERDDIAQAIASTYGLKLSPLVLTSRILDQIGEFDYVKRATYFIEKPDPNTPSNITYADDKLATRSVARAEEDDTRSERKQSFYLIPLSSIEEQGVGATSDSGKLWISREVSLESVREYGIALLERIGLTLDAMTARGEYSQVLSSMGIPHLSMMSDIGNTHLRREIYRLLEQLVNMLLKEEDSRPFALTNTLVNEGVPKYFNYPRLQLVDPDTNDVAYWSDANNQSQLIRSVIRSGELAFVGHPSKEELDFTRLRHPITGNHIKIHRYLDSLHLQPTALLHDTLLEAIKHISTQIEELSEVRILPFRLHGNQLLLDITRALGRSGLGSVRTAIQPREVSEFRAPFNQAVTKEERVRFRERLYKLGEKCNQMSDENCQLCTQDANYLCLRSLVARYFRDHLLLAHKGIELSDIQGSIHVDNKELRIFGFAKKAPNRNSQLTSRNKNGAVLLGQVLNQVDKATFNTVAVISPSTINEDLRDRLEMVCGLLSKRILFIDLPVLMQMLKHFEDQAAFEGIDVEAMYAESARRAQKTDK